MRRRLNIKAAMLLLAANVIMFSACNKISEYSTREVEIRQFTDLSRFGDVIKGGLLVSGSPISLDTKGNIYLLDFKGHRIVICDRKGQEIGQIGQIGQDEESLFHPLGISIDNGKANILNKFGREIKTFTLDNHFLHSIPLKDNWSTNSFCVMGNRYFIAEKTTDEVEYNQKRLISIRGHDGMLMKTMGRIVSCKSYDGHIIFNDVLLQIIKNKIVGAHRNYPVIFCYDLNGLEMFYRYLNTAVPEMRELDEKGHEIGFDRPETIKKEDMISSYKVLNYCYGIGADRNEDIYYAMQLYNLKNLPNPRFFTIRLNKLGKVIEKIIYKKEGRILRTGPIVANQNNELYAIGFDNEKVVFFPLQK